MMASGAMNNNLRVMMPLSLPLLFCQCAILLGSFEGIECTLFEFITENFCLVDIYPIIEVHGLSDTGHFVFKKDDTAESKQYVVQFSDILRESIRVEENNNKVVSFSVKGEDCSDFNIKFKFMEQARHFASSKDPSTIYDFTWARVYSNWRPVIIAYEYLDDDDVGLKLLKNEDYSNLDEYLYDEPFIFKRSEIENEVKMRYPPTLYLRSKSRMQDYEIQFQNTEDLDIFLKLFPESKEDERKTVGYYVIPLNKR